VEKHGCVLLIGEWKGLGMEIGVGEGHV